MLQPICHNRIILIIEVKDSSNKLLSTTRKSCATYTCVEDLSVSNFSSPFYALEIYFLEKNLTYLISKFIIVGLILF